MMMTFNKFMATFPDETACREFLFGRRWPDGVRCPRCGSGDNVYALATKPWHWECSNKACRKGNAYRFSLTAGTIFENTKHPLLTWFKVLYMMLTSKKGVSSRQVRTMFFGDQSSMRTSWYMMHRLRAGMQDSEFRKLMGIVEVDETFIGGKDKNRHWNKKSHITGGSGKATVIGAISRKGSVVAQLVADTSTKTLSKFVRKAVADKVDLVVTDQYGGYKFMDPPYPFAAPLFPHEAIDHSKDEYVRGEVHTNNIESFWSLLKRGIVGTYHNVSKKYLPLYLNEFVFRHNNRNNPDIFGEAVAGC